MESKSIKGNVNAQIHKLLPLGTDALVFAQEGSECLQWNFGVASLPRLQAEKKQRKSAAVPADRLKRRSGEKRCREEEPAWKRSKYQFFALSPM